jgi:hypothetical protein
LPSNGSSGGILVCINENNFEIIDYWIIQFSINIIIKNKNSEFTWLYTIVYGPPSPGQKSQFRKELQDIRVLSTLPWLVGGDFNVVRNKQERKGLTFNHSVSRKVNSFISENSLKDMRPRDRLYTWSNFISNPSFVCLDKFLCTIEWKNEFSNYLSKSLPRYQLDHNALIIKISTTISLNNNVIINFDKK